jgi:predicted secreted protein
MAKISGNLIYIEWDGNIVVGLTDKNIGFKRSMIDTTNQQSTGGWESCVPGEGGGDIGFSGIYDEAGSEGATTLFADLANGTEVAFKIGQNIATGGAFWSGNGIVTGLSIKGPMNAATSYSGTILVTGIPEQSTVGAF